MNQKTYEEINCPGERIWICWCLFKKIFKNSTLDSIQFEYCKDCCNMGIMPIPLSEVY